MSSITVAAAAAVVSCAGCFFLPEGGLQRTVKSKQWTRAESLEAANAKTRPSSTVVVVVLVVEEDVCGGKAVCP